MTVTNQQLISHTYLDRYLQDDARDEAASSLVQGLRDWAPFWDFTDRDAMLDTAAGPTLDLLGFHHAPDADDPRVHLLYADSTREQLLGTCFIAAPKADLPAPACALADRSRGQAGLDDTRKGTFWLYEAVQAARRHGVRWGMLTNGVEWRLVDAQHLTPYEVYLAVDLSALAEGGRPDPHVSRAIYGFFHRDGWRPDDAGKSQLDQHEAASKKATEQAEKHLKAHIETVLGNLCRGFVASDGRLTYTEAERKAIFDSATVAIYRTLFALYAEARGLLPAEDAAYRPHSIAALAQRALDYHVRGIPDPEATTLWAGLTQLWSWIDSGNDALGVPEYNGGLFDDAKSQGLDRDLRYLREHVIQDAYLTDVLVDLTHMPDGDGWRPIDYRDLSVRHLGSLYEGLLEYKLFVAEERLYERRDGDDVRYLRAETATQKKTDRVLTPGDVYFAQSPQERKATGSYYTPEYIVDYIVKHTVRTGLEERRVPLAEQVERWRAEIASASAPEQRAKLARTADAEIGRFVDEEVLTFRVCDPAMGSGHFLVNAAHSMANVITETLNLGGWANPEVESDPAWWRRQLVERCIYGVDLNPLAVELAKLSLWLVTVERGKPLSFLDHHLRPGNSLIGARVADVLIDGDGAGKPSAKEQEARDAGQLSMLDDPAFRRSMETAVTQALEIERTAVETVADVEAKEAAYHRLREELTRKYRRLADVRTARYFGLDVDDAVQAGLIEHVLRGGFEAPQYAEIIEDARGIAEARRFFHWELEFPEVFFDGRGRLLVEEAGFDAVVGNPPWGASVSSLERDHLRRFFGSAEATLDSFALFIEQGIVLLARLGYLGYIVPSGWQTGKSYVPFRRLILKSTALSGLINLPYDVFPDAYVDSMIITAQKENDLKSGVDVITNTVKVLAFERREKLTDIDDSDPRINTIDYSIWFSDELDPNEELVFLSFLTQEDLNIAHKMVTQSVSMGELADIQRGITPFHLKDRKLGDNYEVALDGELRRYYYEFSGDKFVKYDGSIAEYKPQRYFCGPRILLRELISRQFRLQAVFVREDFITNKSHHSVLIDADEYTIGYLLAILNSKVLSRFHVRSSAIALRDDFPKIVLDETRNLPICEIKFDTPANTRAALVEEGRRFYNRYLASGEPAGTLTFVEEQLAHEPERSDVVHDLLAFLAEQMMELHKQRQQLEARTDLFRYVDRDLPFASLSKLLAQELEPATPELAQVHHDVDGLRLSRDEASWVLEVQLKLREPAADWREWQKGGDGYIRRKWVVTHRLAGIREEKARFYQYALPVLSEFEHAKSFPGGFTRSTAKKLRLTKIPQFVDADLAPLVQAAEELAEVKRRIRLTDDLIDQIVYRLYGLTEEEIAVVEGRA